MPEPGQVFLIVCPIYNKQIPLVEHQDTIVLFRINNSTIYRHIINTMWRAAPTTNSARPRLMVFCCARFLWILLGVARSEGKVTWYTTLIVNQAVRPLQQAFEQKYPGVRLEYSRADDSPTALKILTEARAGRVQADILDGLYNMVALRRAGLIAPYRPPNVDQYSPALRDADGYWIAILIYVFTPGVNTNLVPLAEAPTTLRDLLDPRWRGQMAWNPNSIAGAPGFVGNVLLSLGEAAGMEYLRALSGQRIVNV